MDDNYLSEVELIEQAAKKMAKRLSLTYVTDPNKRSTFEASRSGADGQFGVSTEPVRNSDRQRA